MAFLITSILIYLIKPKVSVFPLLLLVLTRERVAYLGALILSLSFSGSLVTALLSAILNEIIVKVYGYKSLCVSERCMRVVPLVLVTAFYAENAILPFLLASLALSFLCYRREAIALDLLAPGMGLMYSSSIPIVSKSGKLKVRARLTPLVIFGCLYREGYLCWKRAEGQYEVKGKRILIVGEAPLRFKEYIEIGEGEWEFGEYGLGVGRSVREVMELVSFIAKLYSLTPAQKERLSEMLMEKYLKNRKIEELILMTKDNVVREVLKEVGYVVGDREVNKGGLRGELNEAQKKIVSFILSRKRPKVVILHEEMNVDAEQVVVRLNEMPKDLSNYDVVIFGRVEGLPKIYRGLFNRFKDVFVVWDKRTGVTLAVSV